MKDIKALLKEARVAIEKKDFQNAMKLAKIILKEDKTNYMAMVFLGFALQEVGPIEQTSKAFHKAIQLNPSNPLAWQGLINYYEKIDTEETKPDLVKSLMSFLDIESNEEKLIKYSKKLVNIQNYGDLTEISNTLHGITKKSEGDTKMEILKLLVDILEDERNTIVLLNLFDKLLPDFISTSVISQKLFSNYLTALYKSQDNIKVLDWSIEMNKLYPDSVLSLSWICKAYNELWIKKSAEIIGFQCSVRGYMDNLLKLEPDNAMGLFTCAIYLLGEKKLLEAKEKLTKVTVLRPGLIYAWFLLTDILIKLECFEESLTSLEKTKKLIQTTDNTSFIAERVIVQELKVLSLSIDPVDLQKAADLYSTGDLPKDECVPYIINVLISLGRYFEAEQHISQCADDEQACLLKVRLLNQQQQYSKALSFFEKYSFNSESWWMELGKIRWSLNEFQKCLEPFLKAAKCNPDNYQSFFWLGNVYSKLNQIDKARRCFEKAFKINSGSCQAGCELSKIYRKLKNWEANFELLTSVATDVINNTNMWAWIQLGLNCLEQGDTENSIEYLRMVVRFCPENVHCWESLADAYFTRGSFTSALKCYEKASDLSKSNLYATLQTGYIKKILGDYAEAKTDFQNILLSNPEYVPALKGLSETVLHEARALYKDERLEAALENAQLATTKISLAILQRSELSCLWKILGDCTYFVAKMPEKYCYLKVPKELMEPAENRSFLEGEELFSLATKCFCKAVNLDQDNPFLWHDLAISYLTYGRHTADKELQEQLLMYAVQAAQKSIELNPSSWEHWNLLGCIHFFKDSPVKFTQHCFIKAIIANHNSAVSWANLGVLYLLGGDIKLANKAFTEGQRADPDYVNSWIGQALIAEGLHHGDTMGLFRHSLQLGHQEQGCLGYANCVCEALINGSPTDKNLQYSLYDLHAIPVACDAIQWYLERNPFDDCAWNLFGILLERMGLKQSSRNAFERAFKYCGKTHKDLTKINFGRLLCCTGNVSEAIDMFGSTEEASFSSGSGLALALFKNGLYEESYAAYEQALHWLTEKQQHQSDLLVALASMAYKFQGAETAKTLLFQSLELQPPSPWSLYATLSLALLHNDEKLAKLVCKELRVLETKMKEVQLDETEYIYHYVTLLSYFYLLRKDKRGARVELSKMVHKYPNQGSAWLTLSMTMYRMENSKIALKVAAKCAQAVIKLGRTNIDVCKVLYLVALSFHMAGDSKNARIFAQKAVHSFPNSAAAWTMMLYLGSYKKEAPKNFSFIAADDKVNQSLISWYENFKM